MVYILIYIIKKTNIFLIYGWLELGVSMFYPTREHDTGFCGLRLGLNGFES